MKGKLKDFCVCKKQHDYVCKRKKCFHKKYKDFQFSMIKELKALKREI